MAVEITIEHLGTENTWRDPRVILHGTLEEVIGTDGRYVGYVRVFGTKGRHQLNSIQVDGKINLTTGEINLTADVPHSGDIFAAPIPTPVEYSTAFGYETKGGQCLFISLPTTYRGTLAHTADNVWMGEVDRLSPRSSKIAIPDGSRAEIQLTLKN